MDGPAAIDAVDIRKVYGDTAAVDGASLTVERGSFVALLGPSGSGKTTLLRTIAGFEVPDAGSIEIGGRIVAGRGVWEEPEHRRVGMVFQDGALFPHLTVGGNVEFGKPRPVAPRRASSWSGSATGPVRTRTSSPAGNARTASRSRALATDPEVVLLDEPFASLDATLRTTLREEVVAILRAAGASALLVTHDQQEALSLADTVVLLRDGRVEQVGTAENVYAEPASRWVTEFLGAVDVLHGTVADGVVTCALGRFGADGARDGVVDVLVRPESVVFGTGDDDTPAGRDATRATVVGRSFYGADQVIRLELADGQGIGSRVPGYVSCRVGDDVSVWVEGPIKVLAAERG